MTQVESVENSYSNGGKITAAELNGNAELSEASKLRQALPQCVAVAAKNILLLTFGSTLGFSTILIPALQSKNTEIPMTLGEISWISSLNLFLVPIGSLFSGPISQYLGRKRTMMWSNIPFVVAWLLFYYANSSAMLFSALAITGLTGGLIEAPVMTYVAEITQPHLRGMLSATSTMSVILGVFTQMLGGSLASWRTVAMVNIVYPTLCFIALVMVPESPQWLAAKGRLKDSERALCWLRGWVTPPHVTAEFRTLCEAIKKPTDSTTEKDPAWKSFAKKTFYVPFLVVALTFFIGAFGGTATLQTYAVVIFADLEAPIDSYTATVFLGVAELVGTITCVSVIHFTGKRKISFLSVAGTALCFALVAVYGYLNDYGIVDNQSNTWIPSSLIIGSAFLSHVGIRLLPWILAGEVFPVKVRSSATGIVGSVGYIFSSISNKSFLYMMNGMSLAGTFVFYAGVNLIGGALLYFVLPETEGRTLREIEEHFAGVQSLKSRPKKEDIPFKEKWAATNPTVLGEDNESRL